MTHAEARIFFNMVKNKPLTMEVQPANVTVIIESEDNRVITAAQSKGFLEI